MQTNSLKNLIVNLYYANSNNNIKHYYIKHNNKVKHIKQVTNKLSNVYKNLYKHYKCNAKQLNLIQFLYANNNNIKQTTKYYNTFAMYNSVIKQVTNNTNINFSISNLLQTI